jgi:hypothetical protein
MPFNLFSHQSVLCKVTLFSLLNEELDLWKRTFAEVFMNNHILVYNVNRFNMRLYIYVFFSI